jgi:hypothetical protein
VPLLRNVHLATDDGMDTLRFGRIVEADGAEEVAVVRHGDGGHFLFGDHLHQLIDFAGAVEQGIVGVVVEVNEWSFGHRKTAIQLSGETTTILTSGAQCAHMSIQLQHAVVGPEEDASLRFGNGLTWFGLVRGLPLHGVFEVCNNSRWWYSRW